MSNNNQRPWYKDPKILIPAIVVILAALIGGIFVLISSPQLPTGTIFTETGGDTDTDGDYEISWESSERAIKYILQEDRDSSFISPRTVYTGSETKKHIYGKSGGVYYYRVRACNNVGESEWSPIRKMTVVISPPLTPTPKPSVTPKSTPTLTSTPTVKITSPKEGDEVPVSTPVSGTFSGELPEGLYMWVVINPHPSPGQWWPQGGRIDPWKGQWNVPAWLGREKEDIGKEFDIAVILVNEKDNQYYTNYLETGQRTGSYPKIPLPPSAKIMDRITVVRI